ncbi:type VI secretion system baseplate subunit TssF [Alcaligenes sp. SDU_A2]|uniref:type VI secretion system baseplate subunit TssF n=1 Tax=Alcaligenes sp. SDU_A2 TaxID=3136634 RepID=UPI002BBD9571|nr:type VI secretion system baseplate subunit TssF [Alcaligenes sp.]HRL27180.1 type VI secretion system baseplate subunit TssF [Alcaligenes sp.]
MQELLPYYEQELAFLRGTSREFSKRYPKIASGLGLTAEVCEDPHVERLIESFALLTARVSKRLDDDYPELTHALFDVLYPHYLRPFPSCSIAQFVLDHDALSAPGLLPRGAVLKSHAVQGVTCSFRTVYDLPLLPVWLDQVHYTAAPAAPSKARVHPQASSRLSLHLKSALKRDGAAFQPRLRLYLHGDASLVAALRDALLLKTVQAFVDEGQDQDWQPLEQIPLQACGYQEHESLIDFPAASHPAYRLLAEHFAFPEKFNFIELDLTPLISRLSGGGGVTLHFMLQGIAADSSLGRLLETTTRHHVRTDCVPVINLFHKKAEPIRLTHTEVAYPVVADARRAYAYEVYSIDRVCQIKQSAHGDSLTEFKPFYSLHHGDSPDSTAGYWLARRNPTTARISPGYETELTLVDLASSPTTPQIETLSLDLSCTNRDLPALISVGHAGGDLTLEGGSPAREIRLLRRPTRSLRFPMGRGTHWRLISHLSLNHLSLVQGGLPSLKETLKLYDLAGSSSSQRQIDGLVGLDYQPATLWMPGEPFASFVRGVEIRLSLDMDYFVGSSLHAFVRVLNHFFALYVHANSFVQLLVLDRRDGTEIMRCEPCNGDSILV